MAGGEGKEEKIEELVVVGEGGETSLDDELVVLDGGIEEGSAGETGKVTEGIDSLKTFHSGSNHLQEVIFFNLEVGSDAVGEGIKVI